MINVKLLLSTLLCVTFLFSLQAQETENALATLETKKKETISFDLDKMDKNAIPYFYRHHKKVPATFSGFAIELTTSDLPLKRDYHLFNQFGNVRYDKVENGEGYSYFIVVNFSKKDSVEKFLQAVIKHRAPEAKVIKYMEGMRIKK